MTVFRANKNALLLPQKMTAEQAVFQCAPGRFAEGTWPHVAWKHLPVWSDPISNASSMDVIPPVRTAVHLCSPHSGRILKPGRNKAHVFIHLCPSVSDLQEALHECRRPPAPERVSAFSKNLKKWKANQPPTVLLACLLVWVCVCVWLIWILPDVWEMLSHSVLQLPLSIHHQQGLNSFNPLFGKVQTSGFQKQNAPPLKHEQLLWSPVGCSGENSVPSDPPRHAPILQWCSKQQPHTILLTKSGGFFRHDRRLSGRLVS